MSSHGSCGTGEWSGPVPGDPDNNVILTASPAFGGIEVSWTYPTTYPHAVSHILLYRATTNVLAVAPQIAVVGGNRYYDKTDFPSTYYYWIYIISVNGTVGAAIGPASAIARPLLTDVTTALTGEIESGFLGSVLSGQVSSIATLSTALSTETTARTADSAAINTFLTSVQSATNTLNTFVQTQDTARITADAALVTSIDLVGVSANLNTAAIATELNVRATADTVIAASVVTAQATLNSSIATVQTSLTANITTTGAIGALYSTTVTANGLVGGFGIYNTGASVEAGFDVSKFWIGTTAANKRKPFIVVGSETFIDQAVINELTFTKLKNTSGSLIVANEKVQAAYLKVETASIDDLAVTIAKIDDLAVTSAKIGALAVTAGKIGSLAVDTLQIANNAVTVPTVYLGNSFSHNFGGHPAILISTMQFTGSPDPDANVMLNIDGTTVVTQRFRAVTSGGDTLMSLAFPFMHYLPSPGSSAITISYTSTAIQNTHTMSDWKTLILTVKK